MLIDSIYDKVNEIDLPIISLHMRDCCVMFPRPDFAQTSGGQIDYDELL